MKGATLTVGRVPDMVSTDGDVIGAANADIDNNVYDTLIKYTPALQARPELATSWVFNKTDTQLTIHLRHGVAFQDGKPFTAADVIYSIDHVRSPTLGSPQLATMSKWITSDTAPDPYTVVLNMDQPHANILDFLNYLCIVDKQTITGPKAKTTANGTGPFELASWKPGIEFVLKRNPNYWGKPPLLSEIDFKIVGSSQSLLTELQGGSVNLAENLPPQLATTLGNTYQDIPDVYQDYYIAANVKNPALSNKLVREAISYAIDRQRFVHDILAGKATPTDTYWVPGNPAYNPQQSSAYSFNLKKAKQLLNQAGVKNLSLELATNAGQPDLTSLAQIVQADLATVGIKITINKLQVPQWRKEAFGASYPALISGPYGFNNFSCQSLFAMSAPLKPKNNFSNFVSPEYTQLVSSALAATSQTQAVKDCQKAATYMQEEAFVIPISTDPSLAVATSAVHDVGTTIAGGLYFPAAYLTK